MNARLHTSSNSNERQRLLWLLALALLLVILYWQTSLSLHLRWTKFEESYSHGYLLLGLSLYFTWLQRFRLARVKLSFAPVYALPLVTASIGWCVAQILSVQVLGQLLLPVALLSAVATAFGYAFARCLLVPLALLYVGIPIWEDFLNTPLREMTVGAVGTVLQVFSFPANVTGYKIEIPEGAFFVAGGCSGLSFFLTGLTISLSYAYLNLSSNMKRLGFVIFCLILSLVSNWVRVGSLVVIGYVTNMQSSLITVSHVMFGWYLFAGAMGIMLLVGHQLSKSDQPNDFDEATGPPSQTTISNAGLALALVGLAIGPALALAYSLVPARTPDLRFAQPILQSDPATANWRPAYRGWTTHAHGVLPGHPSDIDIDLLYYGSQAQNGKLISAVNQLADRITWHEQDATNTNVDGMRVSEAILHNAVGARRIVWYWFDVGGSQTTSGTRTKILQLKRFLQRGRADGALVALSVACPFDCSSERTVLEHSLETLRSATRAALKPTD